MSDYYAIGNFTLVKVIASRYNGVVMTVTRIHHICEYPTIIC